MVFTGGVVTATKTLMVDISNNFLMAEGSEMIRGRYDHACGTFDLDGTSVVVVVGGDDGSNQVSTEIWDGTSNGWFEGIFDCGHRIKWILNYLYKKKNDTKAQYFNFVVYIPLM